MKWNKTSSNKVRVTDDFWKDVWNTLYKGRIDHGFKVGDKVHHTVHGDGIITEFIKMYRFAVVEFDSGTVGHIMTDSIKKTLIKKPN